MSEEVKIRIAARTEAAGKYDPAAPQEGNEDNYGLIPDLSQPGKRIDFDEVVALGDKGLLMFVADGMGGHNAGEVASKIAIDTIHDLFTEGSLPNGVESSCESRAKYMEKAIIEADKRINKHAKSHHECEGMGSTLIMAWLIKNELTLSWCGDSRAYLFHPLPDPHIELLSEDHSYVQEKVKRGEMPYEATFAHPQGNIITRCLGGGGSNARPESRHFRVACGDIVLLCSDGLSGVLFDDGRLYSDGTAISDENICDTMTANHQTLRQCTEALFAAAERQNWYDNVTVILCEVMEMSEELSNDDSPRRLKNSKRRNRRAIWASAIIVAVGLTLLTIKYASQVAEFINRVR